MPGYAHPVRPQNGRPPSAAPSAAPKADKAPSGKGKGKKRASALPQATPASKHQKHPISEKAAPEKPAPKDPAKPTCTSKGPARPEIVVLSFHNSDLAADYAPVSSEELIKLKDAPVANWPIEVKLARAFAMQATRAACPVTVNHNTSYLVPSFPSNPNLQEGPHEWFLGEINRKARPAQKHFWVNFEDGELKCPHLDTNDPSASAQKNGYGTHWLLVHAKNQAALPIVCAPLHFTPLHASAHI